MSYPESNTGPAPVDPGYGQPPGYAAPGMQHMQQMSTNTTVIMGQPAPTSTVIIQQPPPRPSNYLVLAIFVTLCCNAVCGIIAIVFSVMSSSAADSEDLDEAKKYGKVSMWLSVAGIISTVLLVVFIIIYFTVIVTKTVQTFG